MIKNLRRPIVSATVALVAAVLVSEARAADRPSDDDHQTKAQQQMRKISALAADPVARPLVSMTVAEFLKIPRMELVRQRQAINLSYGSLFVAWRLVKRDATMQQITDQLHAGKSLWQIGNEENADWARIAADGKKLNDKIEATLYDFFLNGADAKRYPADGYVAANDVTPSDLVGLSKQDLDAARNTYARCYQRARGWAPPKDLPNQNNRDMPNTEGDPR